MFIENTTDFRYVLEGRMNILLEACSFFINWKHLEPSSFEPRICVSYNIFHPFRSLKTPGFCILS